MVFKKIKNTREISAKRKLPIPHWADYLNELYDLGYEEYNGESLVTIGKGIYKYRFRIHDSGDLIIEQLVDGSWVEALAIPNQIT